MEQEGSDTKNYLEEHECAILCIDLRGSTKESALPHRVSRKEAERIEKLFEVFETFTGECRPDFVKSTGDGLMSFWHLKRPDRTKRLKDVASIALDLNNNLADRLGKELDTGKSQTVGLGLAFGGLTKINKPDLKDYFGFPANLAAKLQDLARPDGGLVIQKEYVDDEVKEIEKCLTPHDFLDGSALRGYNVKGCYSSEKVKWLTDWTCLAWSGFATSGLETDEPAPDYKFGLNNIGLTVLTHQGLRGKVGTLEIWQRAVPQANGDSFELIIDDFDALASMSRDKLLGLRSKLAAGSEESRASQDILKKICRSLVKVEKGEDFLFVPIRCGINGLIWNTEELPEPPAIHCYRELGKKLEEGQIAPNDIGLYDNLGATLPLLIMMMTRDRSLSISDLYESDWGKCAPGETLNQVLERLTSVVNPKRKFKLYSKAEDLSGALHNGEVKVAVGGGAWLINPDLQAEAALTSGLPSKDGGLLWVEGAAVTVRAADTHLPEILAFLSKQVLARDYQQSLAIRKPYTSSPVTIESIDAVLKKTDPSPIDVETKIIFESTRKTHKLLTHRRRPDQIILWVDAWNRIVRSCCQPAE